MVTEDRVGTAALNRRETTAHSRRWLLWLLAPLALALWWPSTAGAAGGFAPQIEYPVGSGPSSVATGDFNGDGDPDLAVANFGDFHTGLSNTVSVLLGGAGGGFAAQATYPVGTGPTAVATGDFDGDGDPDLAVTNFGDNTVSVLLGQAGGSFGEQTAYPVEDAPTSVAVRDFDGDGDPDLAVTNEFPGTAPDPGSVSVLLGQAGGSFGEQTAYPVGSRPVSIAAGDFNGDGDPDLAVATLVPDSVSVLLGGPGASFGAETTYPVGGGTTSVAIDDFNGDGDPDLAVGVWFPDYVVAVLGGEAGGSFGPATAYPADHGPTSVAAGDFNGDGDPDLAIAVFDDAIWVLLGGPGAGFGPKVGFPVGNEPSFVAAEDFNGDANPDLAAANRVSGTLSVLLNAGEWGIDFDPASVTFTPTVIGTQSASRTVVLQNTSAGDVSVSGVALAGDDAGNFAISADSCSGATLATTETCAVGVRFGPGHLGAHSARLEFTDDAPGSPQSVALSGTGTDPVTLSPASLAWAPRPDSTTRGRKVTLRNVSGGDLAVSGVALAGADTSSFRLPPAYDECTATTVPAGGTCDVKVRFGPDGVGPKSARLEFTDEAVTSPQTVALSGTGTPGPWLTRSVQALKFGHVRVGTTTAAKAVTLTNTGSAPMPIGSITVEGDNPGDFVGLAGTCTTDESLDPDESCDAEIAFTPSATGERRAHLRIEDTAPRSPHRVQLRGTGR